MTAAPPKAPACTHDSRAACWLCSDQVAWWKAARIKAGYGEEPPNMKATYTMDDRLFATVLTPPSTFTELEEGWMRRLNADGDSIASIARFLDKNPNAVRNWLQKQGLRPGPYRVKRYRVPGAGWSGT